MEVSKEKTTEILAAVEQYAKEHDIVITGKLNHLYSMLKYKVEHFPENTMFLSYNLRGRLIVKNQDNLTNNKPLQKEVTIVFLSPDKITHCLSKHILERSQPRESFNFNFHPGHRVYLGGMVIDF